MLLPDPAQRISIKEIKNNAWLQSISICTATNVDLVDHKHNFATK